MKKLATFLLVIGLAVSACGGKSDPPEEAPGLAALEGDEPQTGEDSGHSSTTSADKKGSKGQLAGKPGGTTKGAYAAGSGSSSSTSGGGGTSSGGAGATGTKSSDGAAAATPIPAGSYSYDTRGSQTVSGNERDMPRTTGLMAEAPNGGEQVQIRDLRDGEGNGTVTETHLAYRSDGVYLTYVKVTSTFSGGLTDVRELRPKAPQLVAPTGGGPGFSTRFTLEGSGTKADVSLKALKTEKITVGGSTVTALVVDTDIVFSGSIEGRQSSMTWFHPEHIMALREQVSTDVTNGPIRVQTDYEATLEKLP